MNKETLLARIEAYKADIVKNQNDLAQAQANIQALNGAIQDSQYWLSQLPVQQASTDVGQIEGLTATTNEA